MSSADQLAEMFIFKGVDRSALLELCTMAPPVSFKTGVTIFTQGDESDVALLLLDGLLGVEVTSAGQHREVGQVNTGEIVGETSALCARRKAKRHRPRPQVEPVLAHQPGVAAQRREEPRRDRHRATPTRDAGAPNPSNKPRNHQALERAGRKRRYHRDKGGPGRQAEIPLWRSMMGQISPADSDRLAKRIVSHHAFPGASHAAIERVLHKGECEPLPHGANICVEGEPGDEIFFLVQGNISVLRRDINGEDRVLSDMTCPCVFGHMAVIDGSKRSATCRANGPVEIVRLHRSQVDRLISEGIRGRHRPATPPHRQPL